MNMNISGKVESYKRFNVGDHAQSTYPSLDFLHYFYISPIWNDKITNLVPCVFMMVINDGN